MNRFRHAWVGFWTIIVIQGTGHAAAQRNVRILSATGSVTLMNPPLSKVPVQVGKTFPIDLKEGDILETGPQVQAKVQMDRETVLIFRGGSRMKIKKLFSANTQLEMTKGSLLAKVRPTGPQAAFIIKLPNAVVAVRTANFAADISPGLSQVGVF